MPKRQSLTPIQKELRAVYSMHNDAIQRLETGDLESSKKTFSVIFSSVDRLIRGARKPDEFCFKGSPIVKEPRSSPEFSDRLLESSSQDVDLKKKCPLNADLPVDTRPLKLPEQSSINQFAFVSLYNLALSTHLSALTSEGAIEKGAGMRKASKLWELVYAFQWRNSLNLKPVHALAILANLGHAHCLAGNESGSRKCFENILSALQILEGRKQKVPDKSFYLYTSFRMLGATSTNAAEAA